MKVIEKGLSYTSKYVVTNQMSAKVLGSGDMEVLATPAMVAIMENAAMLSIMSNIEATESTVGISISTTHVRATTIGKEVQATATVKEIDGRRISFEIIASDDKGVIGVANHDRFIVDREKFISRL